MENPSQLITNQEEEFSQILLTDTYLKLHPDTNEKFLLGIPSDRVNERLIHDLGLSEQSQHEV